MTAPTTCSLSFVSTLVVTLLAATVVPGSEPLHERIDETIEQASVGGMSPVAGDAEFLRRVYLDLIGVIPSAQQARQFLSDQTAAKREILIDRLLADRRYARHWANVFDVFLMERRRDKHVSGAEWQEYLYQAFLENKPWNLLAREILAADGTQEKIRAASKFYLEREAEVDLVTRDVGRVFFGMDLQCCQCHDHPIIDTFYQADYYGIYAFLNRGFLFTDQDKKAYFAEKAAAKVEYVSVFTEEKGTTLPRLPGGFQVTEPAYLSGSEYQVEPADKVRPIPRFSRREQLAELATDGKNRAFNRNIVNRLWALMMGRGLVDPVDLHHVGNPPSHPQLLQLLADEFVAMGYDIKAFLRELALTETYQRSSLPVKLSDVTPESLAAKKARWQSALDDADARYFAQESELESLLAAVQKLEGSLGTGAEKLTAVNKQIDEADKKRVAAQKKATEAERKLPPQRGLVTLLQAAANSAVRATEQLTDDEEITAAAAQFSQRAEKLAAELAAAVASHEKLQAQADQAEQTWAAARAAGEELVAELEQLAGQYEQAVKPLRIAKQRLAGFESAAATAAQRLEILERVNVLAEARRSAVQSREELVAAQQHLLRAQRVLESDEAELQEQQATIAERDDQLAKLRPQHQAAARFLSERQAILDAVTAAAQKTAEAVGQLPMDDPLRSAAAVFEARRAQSEIALAEAQGSFNELAASVSELEQEWDTATERLQELEQQLQEKRSSIVPLRQRVAELTPQLEEAELASREAERDWLTCWQDHGFTARLRPLAPEQLARSLLQATGIWDRHLRGAESEAANTLPPSPTLAKDRLEFVEGYLEKKLAGHYKTFAGLFGHASGQPQADFFATVDQALYFLNSSAIQSWLKAAPGSLTAKLAAYEDAKPLAEELYLSVFTRFPTVEEEREVADYLEGRSDREIAIREMCWGLLTSVEFRFIH